MATATWFRLPAARRQAVYDAAEAEFAARGYSGASLNTICRDAGVSKGSLFQYFTDKADMYLYLSEEASLRIRAAMVECVETLDWDGDFRGSFAALIEHWVRYFDDHPRDLAMTAAANLEPDPVARAAVREAVNAHYVEVLRPLLERGVASAQLRESIDIDAVLTLLLVLLPHVALAPHVTGLDPLLGMADGPDQAVAAALRLLSPVISSVLVTPSP